MKKPKHDNPPAGIAGSASLSLVSRLKRVIPIALLAIGLPVFASGGAPSQSLTAAAKDPGLKSFLPRFEEATRRFINGDPGLWKENASQRDDVTIMGGWGAYARGWSKVRPWYDWAAARFKESGAALKVEYISSEVSGDLAYTVAIERSAALVVGQEKAAPMALRVTHIFRREGGVWKLVHRHADPLMDKTAPPAVLQKSND
jgi:ketosteroid isomerase-like protein